jgi:hypothetical protein
MTLNLRQTGNTIDGSHTATLRTTSPAGCFSGGVNGSVTGTVDGSAFTLTLLLQQSDPNGPVVNVTYRLSGSLAGNTISGSLTGGTATAPNVYTGTFTLTR